MIIPKYDPTKKYDDGLKFIIKGVKASLVNKNDDFLMICAGTTGTGKSSLSLHVIEEFLGDEASVDYIGLHKADFATALKRAADKPGLRFCCNDEANISKRDSLTKYNKDIIDLYMAIRGKRIFHWWNNPSLDMIDKHFIEERIKGLIYIKTKDKDKPRVYYYFRKRELLQIWEKYGNLKLNLLSKIKGKYAYYRGCFRDYDGRLKQDYLNKKDDRMDEKINLFYETYGIKNNKDMLKLSQLGTLTGINPRTLIKYLRDFKERGIITDDDFYQTPTGHNRANKRIIPLLMDKANENKLKSQSYINSS